MADESDACGHSIVDCHGLRTAVRVWSYFGTAPFFLVAPVSDWIRYLWNVGGELFLVLGFHQLFHQVSHSAVRWCADVSAGRTVLFGVDFGRILGRECLGTARYLLGEADVSVYLVRIPHLPFFT